MGKLETGKLRVGKVLGVAESDFTSHLHNKPVDGDDDDGGLGLQARHRCTVTGVLCS